MVAALYFQIVKPEMSSNKFPLNFGLAGRSPASTAMLAIIVAAFGLRVWGIWFGLPFLFHDDEGFEVIRALQLGSGEFDFDRIGKGGYFYLLFVEYGLLFVGLKIFGVVESANDFALYFVRDPSAFYLIGRATTAIIGTATVFVVYRIGQIAYSERAAVFAASIFAVNVLHADLSHYIVVDVPMVFLATVSLYFAIRLAESGAANDYFWAALFAACATTTKVPAVLLVVPLLCAHYLYSRKNDDGVRGFFMSRPLWQALVVFLGIYLLLTPGMIVNFTTWLPSMFEKFGSTAGSVEGEVSLGNSGVIASPNLFVYYLIKLRAGMSGPILLICIAGVIYGIWSRRSADVILISFGLTVFVVMSIATDFNVFFPRYILPMMPVLSLLGGRVLCEGFSKVGMIRRSAFQYALLVSICLVPAYEIVANDYRIAQTDTRVLAKDWVDANIPPGSRIFIEGSRTHPSKSTIPLTNTAENIRASINYFREKEPGKSKYFELELEVMTGHSYDLELVASTELQSLPHYIEIGVEYFVLRPGVHTGIRLKRDWPDFIMDIRNDPNIIRIKSFQPDSVSVPGPLIEIFQLNADAISH